MTTSNGPDRTGARRRQAATSWLTGLSLLLIGLGASRLAPGAEAWPASLKVKGARPSDPLAYLDACLKSFNAELAAMRKLYKEECGELPPKGDMLFSDDIVPDSPSFTLRVTGDIDTGWPKDAGKKDKRKPGILTRLSCRLHSRGGAWGWYRWSAPPGWKPPKGAKDRKPGTKPTQLKKVPPEEAIVTPGARMFIGGSKIRLAANNLTASLTDLCRSITFSVETAAGQVAKRTHTGPIPVSKKADGKKPEGKDSDVQESTGTQAGGKDSRDDESKKRGGEGGVKMEIKEHMDEYVEENEKLRGEFEVVWDAGLEGESKGSVTRLFGMEPGIHEVRVVAKNVFLGTTACPRGVRTAYTEAYRWGWVNVFKVVRVGLLGVDLGVQGRAVPIPTYVVDAREKQRLGGYAGVRLQPAMVIEHGVGSLTQELPAGKYKIVTEGSSAFHLRPTADGAILARYMGGVGQVRFAIETVGSGGEKLRSPSYTLAANKVDIAIAPWPPFGAIGADTPYKVIVTARGPGDMKNFEVFWRLPQRWMGGQSRYVHYGGGGALGCRVEGSWGRATAFRQESAGVQVASTQLRIDASSLQRWLQYDLEKLLYARGGRKTTTDGSVIGAKFIDFHAVVRKKGEQNGIGLSLPTRFELAPPAIKTVKLQARLAGAGGPWAAAPKSFDVFIPASEALRTVHLSCQVEFAGGAVLSAVDPMKTPGIALRWDTISGFDVKNSDLVYSSYDTSGKSQAVVHAVARTHVLHHNAGLTLLPGVGEIVTDKITVLGNRLVLASYSFSFPRRLNFQLLCFGKTMMGPFKARWNMRSAPPQNVNVTITKNFLPASGGSFYSTVDAAGRKGARGSLRSVEVVNPQGKVVSELAGDPKLQEGARVELFVPRQAPIGGQLMAVAQVRNLNYDLAGRTKCRWSVKPESIGAFKMAETMLSPVGGGVYRSTGVLVLKDSAKSVGRRPRLHVDLVLGD